MNLLQDCQTPHANSAHTSSTSYNKMLRVIRQVDLDELRGKVERAMAMSVVCDESTAIDATGKLAVGVLLCIDGDMELCFVALRDLKGDATGLNISERLIDSLVEEAGMEKLSIMMKLV